MPPRTPNTSTHPGHGLTTEEQIVAHAERDFPDVKLTRGERANVAKVVSAKRALKKIPPVHATPSEIRAKIGHKRTLHKHSVEVNHSLGEHMANEAISHAERSAAPGSVIVAEIADALKALRVPSIGRTPLPAHRSNK